MTQENFDNPELKDVFDDLISQDKFDILSCDEPYAHQICLLKKFAHIRLLEKISFLRYQFLD